MLFLDSLANNIVEDVPLISGINDDLELAVSSNEILIVADSVSQSPNNRLLT